MKEIFPGNGFKVVILTLLIKWRERQKLHLTRGDLFQILEDAYRKHLFSSEWYLDIFECLGMYRYL